MMEGYSDTCDVVVVGGGVSGLVAAITLLQHDPNLAVTLLEATDQLGGRAARGFGWGVGPLFQQLVSKDLGLHHKGKHLRTALQSQTDSGTWRNLRLFEPSEVPRIGGWRGGGLATLLDKIDKLISQIENCSFAHPDKSEEFLKLRLDCTTVFTWLEANTSNPEVKAVIEALLRGLLGAELGQVHFLSNWLFILNLKTWQVSLLHLVHLCRGSGSAANLLASILQSSPEQLAANIKDLVSRLEGQARLVTKEKVVAVEQNGEEGVSVISQSGSIFHSRRLVLCIPPSQQSSLAWSPPLPKLRAWALSQWCSGNQALFSLPLLPEELHCFTKLQIGTVLSSGAASFMWRRRESMMGMVGGRQALLSGQMQKKVSSKLDASQIVLIHHFQGFGSAEQFAER